MEATKGTLFQWPSRSLVISITIIFFPRDHWNIYLSFRETSQSDSSLNAIWGEEILKKNGAFVLTNV